MKIAAAISLASALLDQAIKVSQLINAAQAAGHSSITEEDLDKIVGDNAVAREILVDAIARAKAEGR